MSDVDCSYCLSWNNNTPHWYRTTNKRKDSHAPAFTLDVQIADSCRVAWLLWPFRGPKCLRIGIRKVSTHRLYYICSACYMSCSLTLQFTFPSEQVSNAMHATVDFMRDPFLVVMFVGSHQLRRSVSPRSGKSTPHAAFPLHLSRPIRPNTHHITPPPRYKRRSTASTVPFVHIHRPLPLYLYKPTSDHTFSTHHLRHPIL